MSEKEVLKEGSEVDQAADLRRISRQMSIRRISRQIAAKLIQILSRQIVAEKNYAKNYAAMVMFVGAVSYLYILFKNYLDSLA